MSKDEKTNPEFAAWRAQHRPGSPAPDKRYLQQLGEVRTIDDWEALQAAQARRENA